MITRPVVPTLATAPTKNQLLGQFLAASSERRANARRGQLPRWRRRDLLWLPVRRNPRRVDRAGSGGLGHGRPTLRLSDRLAGTPPSLPRGLWRRRLARHVGELQFGELAAQAAPLQAPALGGLRQLRVVLDHPPKEARPLGALGDLSQDDPQAGLISRHAATVARTPANSDAFGRRLRFFFC